MSAPRRAVALGRLLRLSLAPSALADVLAGTVLGAGGWPPAAGAAPWLLAAGSLCVYHGGMALNDWADRAEDARVRPERPLPSGAFSAPFALVLGLALLAAGPLIASTADTSAGLLLAGVAACALFYDLGPRGSLAGPLLLALCRAGNLGAGVLLGLPEGASPALVPMIAAPLLYGGYVLVVSLLGRLEDAPEEPGERPTLLVRLAALLLAAVPLLGLTALLSPPRGAPAVALVLSALVAWAGAAGLARLARRDAPWVRGEVLAAMGMALRRLLVFTAACAALVPGVAGPVVAAVILAGYPLSFALRRVFPPS